MFSQRGSNEMLCRGCSLDGRRTVLQKRSNYSAAHIGHCKLGLRNVAAVGIFTPHHDSDNHPYKIGKVHCGQCGLNLGNIQIDLRDPTEVLTYHAKKANLLVRSKDRTGSWTEESPLRVKSSAVKERGRRSPEEIEVDREAAFHKAMCAIAQPERARGARLSALA